MLVRLLLLGVLGMPAAVEHRRRSPRVAPDPYRFVSLREAEDYAGIPVKTLRDWIRKGRLPAYRMGPRKLQVNLDDLEALRRPVPTVRKTRATR